MTDDKLYQYIVKMCASLWIFLALLACAVAADQKRVICYWGSWSVYRSGNGNFNTANIDANLCTHLIYAFVGFGSNGTIRILDKFADLPDGGGKDGYNLFNQLRDDNPSLKTLIGIGGWNEGSVNCSLMVTDSDLRSAFVQNAVVFVKKYRFNGLDFDWDYPTQRGGASTDKENFVLLIKELREAFDEEGLLLSAAVAASSEIASQAYDIPQLSKYLDFINLMEYDFHVGSENVTDSNAPLYAGSWEQGDNLLLNVNASVNYWLSQGAPAEKLNLGIPLYGHTFTLANVSDTDIGAPAAGPGIAGPYSAEAGVLSYLEICEKQLSEEWTILFSEEQRVPYAFRNEQWISYENVESIKEKADYLKALGLGGAMVWSLESEDAKGICGAKNPLLTTLNEELRIKNTTNV